MLGEVGGGYGGDGSSFKQCTDKPHDDNVDSSEDEVVREILYSGSDDASNAQTAKSQSRDQVVVSRDTSGDSQEGSKVDAQHRCSGDVEEGEVSDSSEEVSRATSETVVGFAQHEQCTSKPQTASLMRSSVMFQY